MLTPTLLSYQVWERGVQESDGIYRVADARPAHVPNAAVELVSDDRDHATAERIQEERDEE